MMETLILIIFLGGPYQVRFFGRSIFSHFCACFYIFIKCEFGYNQFVSVITKFKGEL